jgi:hypothetical protein
MRIYLSPVLFMNEKPPISMALGVPTRERFRTCEVPFLTQLFHTMVFPMPSRPCKVSAVPTLHNCNVVMTARAGTTKGLSTFGNVGRQNKAGGNFFF